MASLSMNGTFTISNDTKDRGLLAITTKDKSRSRLRELPLEIRQTIFEALLPKERMLYVNGEVDQDLNLILLSQTCKGIHSEIKSWFKLKRIQEKYLKTSQYGIINKYRTTFQLTIDENFREQVFCPLGEKNYTKIPWKSCTCTKANVCSKWNVLTNLDRSLVRQVSLHFANEDTPSTNDNVRALQHLGNFPRLERVEIVAGFMGVSSLTTLGTGKASDEGGERKRYKNFDPGSCVIPVGNGESQGFALPRVMELSARDVEEGRRKVVVKIWVTDQAEDNGNSKALMASYNE